MMIKSIMKKYLSNMRSLTALMLPAFCLLAADLAQAAEIIVRDAGALRSALHDLQPGTTLRIAPGEYPGDHAVVGVERLTIEALDPKQPPVFKGGKTGFQFSRCTDLTLRHLRISGQSVNGLNIDDGGDLARPVKGVTLEHIEVSDIGPTGNHDGIKCSGLDQATIRHCTITGWGGQGIDFVGCHRSLITDCRLIGKEGFSASAGIQLKGGTSDITVEECHFTNAGDRPLNLGGSTGLPYFRPQGAKHEATRLIVRNNTIEGGLCAAAFVGVDGAEFVGNTVRYPVKWIFRILQETQQPGFAPCRNVLIKENRITFRRSQVRTDINIGDGTAPETFRFENNHWLAEDQPQASKPRLPAEEKSDAGRPLLNSLQKTSTTSLPAPIALNAVGKLPRIRVDKESLRFVDAAGQRFTPCGVSYYRPGTGWAPQLWKQFDAEATRQDFQRMKRMGMNVARVFVTFGSFYTQQGQLDASGLATFDRMLDLADEAGIYLHPTGPEHWEGMPPWAQGLGGVFDNFANEACLKALEDFWKLFVGRYRGRTTIWAYDLRNEPTTAWDTPQSRVKWDAWRTARQQPIVPVPDKTNAPSAILADYQRFRESLAEAWVARQATAIHAADPQALVTVGLLQWSIPAQPIKVDQYTGFRPEVIARHLDFISLHFYPLAKGVYRYESQAAEDANLAVVECMTRECAKPGKPVVIAEFGWYGGGPLDPGGKPADEEQQARWCKRLVEVTAPMACGWINWGLYDMPEAKDVSRLTGLITTGGVVKAWGKTFGPLVKGFPPVRALPSRPDLPWESCTMDAAAMTRFQAEYLEAFLAREL